MPELLVVQTTPQVEGLTRNQVLKHFLSESGLGVTGVATGGSDEVLVDTSARQSSVYSPATYEGQWLRINDTSNSLAPEGEIRPVTVYTPAAGRLAVSPQFSATIESGDDYELWRIEPQRVLDLLDRILTQDLFIPCWTVLSELPDYDMEQTAVTDWIGVSATPTKSSAEPPMAGEKYLVVTATGANGYARTPLIGVEPGKPYFVSALARYSTSNGELRVWDETNNALIKSITVDTRYNIRPSADFNTPATCKQVTIRLVTVTNAGVTEWDEVVLYSQEARSIALPWWVKSRSQVRDVYQLHGNPVRNDLWTDELRGIALAEGRQWRIRDNPLGRGQLRLQLIEGHMSHPIYIMGLRNETAYADNHVEIKHVDLNYLTTCLCYRTFSHLLQSPDVAYLERKWLNERRNYYEKRYHQYELALMAATQDGNYGN